MPRKLKVQWLGLIVFAWGTQSIASEESSWLPIRCEAKTTVGLHDFVEEDTEAVEAYELTYFFESKFELRENKTFNEMMGEAENKFFVSMKMDNSEEISEFTCEEVRGRGGQAGFSCLNTPPSEILMINPATLRFTRSAIGSWTFFTPSDHETGASLFVEYGQCRRLTQAEDASE